MVGIIKKFLVNREAIEEELINSEVLVANKIQPYYSLSCLKNIDYDMKHCQETCPQNSFERCLDIFERRGYVELGDVK